EHREAKETQTLAAIVGSAGGGRHVGSGQRHPQRAAGPARARKRQHGRRGEPDRHRLLNAHPLPPYCISTAVKSWSQLCALVKPFTFLVIARGLRSWTMNSQTASSTSSSCAFLVLAAISAGSADFSILSISASNSGLFQLAQLNPLGGKVFDRKKV